MNVVGGPTPSSPKKDNDPRDSCRDFLNKGRCRYGPQCKFKHIDSSGRVGALAFAGGVSSVYAALKSRA